jgi:hypothetical protein
VSDGPTVNPPPPFVPPTNPPEFAVEQAVQLLARAAVRGGWEDAGRKAPTRFDTEVVVQRLAKRVREAAARLAGTG